jgi:rhodanese-related sulfurtransferase
MSEIEISVAELQRRRKAGDKFLLVDVREQWEYNACRIEGA